MGGLGQPLLGFSGNRCSAVVRSKFPYLVCALDSHAQGGETTPVILSDFTPIIHFSVDGRPSLIPQYGVRLNEVLGI